MRLAIIGFSQYLQTRYLPYLKKRKDISLCAVCDVASLQIDTIVGHDIPTYTNVDNMLACERPDAVIISSPHSYHAHQAAQCLNSGIPTFVDKPLACTLGEARRLVELAEQKQVLLGVGNQRRYEPPYRQLYDTVKEGRLGDIRLINFLVANSPWHDHTRSWRGDPSISGGGALIDIGYLALDIIIWLVGAPLNWVHAASPKNETHKVEQTLVLTAEFSSGTIVNLVVTYETAPGSVQEELSVYGNRGSIFTRRFQTERCGQPPIVIEHIHGKKSHSFQFDAFADNSRPLADFLDHLPHRKGMLADGESNLAILEIIERAYKSLTAK